MISSISTPSLQPGAALAAPGLDPGARCAMAAPQPAEGSTVVALSPEGLALAGLAQDPAALAPVDAAQPAGAAGLGCAVLLFYMLLMRELLARQYGG